MLWVDRLIKPSPTNAPPSPGEPVRNDLAVATTVLFALILALGVRNQVYNAAQYATLNDGRMRIAYPDRWVLREQDDSGFTAVLLAGSSAYATRVEVSSRLLREGETLEQARFERSLQLASELTAYRELESVAMQVFDGAPAIVTTYGFVADPMSELGAIDLPVVVEAQDIQFVDDGWVYVISLRADATLWESAAHSFAVVRNSIRLRTPDDTGSAPEAVRGFEGVARP
ncbi:MAG: hypothetical protein NZ553_18700 [Caldilinea sp.]|nr:hypothetical protein [Caldilinea sp.]MDW8442510.1 hypothetical protein [Caldilineaceae bacterium]